MDKGAGSSLSVWNNWRFDHLSLLPQGWYYLLLHHVNVDDADDGVDEDVDDVNVDDADDGSFDLDQVGQQLITAIHYPLAQLLQAAVGFVEICIN